MSKEVLFEGDNFVIAQQIIATETGSIALEELNYLNPEENTKPELKEILHTLEEADLITVINEETPDGMPSEFYAATEKLRETLQEIGVWEATGTIYQMYSMVERTERIDEIRSYYPNSPICEE